MNSLKVERGKVRLLFAREMGVEYWRAEVGGLDKENRFCLEEQFESPGDALDAAITWAKQRQMMVTCHRMEFSVMGEPPVPEPPIRWP